MKFPARKVSGKMEIHPRYRDAMKQFISKQKDGSDFEITIEKKSSSLTANQRAYYFMIVGIIGSSCGYTKEEMHETLKRHFGFVVEKVNPFTQEPEKLVRSITGFSVEEMSDLIDRTFRFGVVDLGLQLPTPEMNGLA